MSKFWDDIYNKCNNKIKNFIMSFKTYNLHYPAKEWCGYSVHIAEQLFTNLDNHSYRIRYSDNNYDIYTTTGNNICSMNESDMKLFLAIIGEKIGVPPYIAFHHAFVDDVILQCMFMGIILHN
jgi:hypothetical protein